MEKRSSHWLDSFTWVKKVYLSAKTPEQEKVAELLLMNFERLHKDKDVIKLCWNLRDEYLKSKYSPK